MSDLVRHYIDGTWDDDPDAPTAELRNPANLNVTGRVQLGGQAEVDRAVAAARKAFESYSRTNVEERIALLQRIVAEFQNRAAGCTVILKPAENVSHSGEILAEIMDAAGVPAGVFNLIIGKGSVIGTALSKHPDVDMVAFTGSTEVGIQVQKNAADTVKRVSQELGGKSGHIVLPDADLDLAVRTAVNGVMGNSGQTCAAPTRTLIPAELRDEFLDRVRHAVEALTIGDPTTDVNLSTVANETQWHTVQHYIQLGIDEGATLITGGLGKPDDNTEGWFVRPTVFADVTNTMRIAREEIFGPVMSILTYRTVDEAIRLTNDSPYGLAGYVTGTNLTEAQRVAAQIRAAQIMINTDHPDITAPFGGYRQSGNGRIWGRTGLEEYLETKALVGTH